MDDRFVYQAFRVGDDRRAVFFDYLLSRDGNEHRLTEQLAFPFPLADTPAQQAALRALHIALGISYYKTFLPPSIQHPYKMGEAEAAFWNDVWRNGLGEFLYVNKLSPDTLAKFAAQDGAAYNPAEATSESGAALLGIGGGKDSIVAGEVLKSIGTPIEGFVMATGEQLGQAKAVAGTMGVPLHVVERTLDKQLLELQDLPGGHKGHVPISLIFGLVGTTLTVAGGKRYVVVANESSASLPRHSGAHGDVNHQWSKSFGFERQFQRFVHEYIAAGVTYFSAIRQMSSVAVASLFSRFPQYFEVFTSDNFVFRIDPSKRPNARWSLESPKSLSSFILLAPWLNEADMLRIFGRNFLDEPSLEPLFLALVGKQGEPPLDCVGTVDELVLSLNLAWQQGKFAGSCLMRAAQQHEVLVDQDWRPMLESMLTLQDEQAIPPAVGQALRDKLNEGLRHEMAAGPVHG